MESPNLFRKNYGVKYGPRQKPPHAREPPSGSMEGGGWGLPSGGMRGGGSVEGASAGKLGLTAWETPSGSMEESRQLGNLA